MVHGARGKMGARLVAVARDDNARFNVVAAHDVHDSEQADRLAPGSVDVLIDFSSDQGARRAASVARSLRCALLVGTTGLSQDSLDFIEQAARSVAVMVAANTSLGVAVLNHLSAEAARLLGPEFSIDVIEAHHTAKRDAPSGTALRLTQALRDRAGVEVPRERVHSVRAGDIIGEHSIQFAGPGEILCISHSATNRDLFVRGALRAAAWLCGKPAGRYTIEQSLGLR
jgi:4-hydroxy-tetrahydrodipicolinate reductase